MCGDHPRRAFGGLYHCAKFGWNRCSSFDNMHVFRFREFGLKMPIHDPKLGVFRRKIGEVVGRYWPPTNSFLLLGVYTSVSNLVKIDEEMRPGECPQTDTHTHARTDAKRFYYLSHAICYSYGADKNLCDTSPTLNETSGSWLHGWSLTSLSTQLRSYCTFHLSVKHYNLIGINSLE